ncbi:MAG: M48 family metallopeptidase [Sarcina sp.]
MNDLLKNLKNKNIEIEIKKLKKKSVSIEIDNRGKVVFRVPTNIKKIDFDKILEKRYDWIVQNVAEIKEMNKIVLGRTFKENDIFLYLGEEYKLKFAQIPKIDMIEKNIYTTVDNKRESLEKLYKFLAKNYIIERVEYYLDKFKIIPKSIKIKQQKTRWGSCSFDNNLNFNYKIIMAKKELVDYLIIHEMCHMEHKNHSAEFWRAVEEILPNYKILRKELKVIGFKLDL